MGVDYNAYHFFGAKITDSEWERICGLEEWTDEWLEEKGLDYKVDGFEFLESGTVCYTEDHSDGSFFVCASETLTQIRIRWGEHWTKQTDPPYPKQHSLIEFLQKHKIKYDKTGWFLIMRVC